MVLEDINAIYAKGIRLTPEAYEFLEGAKISETALQKIFLLNNLFVTREMLQNAISSEEKIPTQAVVSRAAGFRPAAKEYEASYKVID